MSCISMSVGLGNVWRFPFTAYENGGGAFLIPYLIVLIIIGRPMYYMEMALGQFTSRGNMKTLSSLSPVFTGVGWAQVIATTCLASYFCELIGLTLFFLINSFTSDLPWSTCKPEWEEENIIDNITCIASSEKNNVTISNKMTSSELWFTKEVLNQKNQIDDGLGTMQWRLVVCLLISWCLTLSVSIKGVKSSGKFSYFLALFPYVILGAVLVRAVTLEGALSGILYFITPDWSKIATANIWYAAVTQCIYSLNVGEGSIIMYASYNTFNHNITRDALVISVVDTLTSLLAGTAIFGILGNLAYQLNVPLKDVITTGGTGLAFITYPEAIAKFEHVPWLFSILFFLMLLILGVGSLVAHHLCLNTTIMDHFPAIPAWKVSCATAFVGFLLGLIYTTQGGQYMLTVTDFFGVNMIMFICTILEVIAVMWFYGCENFCNDLQFMTKNKVGIFWRWTWSIFTPISLIVIFTYFIGTITRLNYGAYKISDWALGIGWSTVALAVIIIITNMLYQVWTNRNFGFTEMLTKTFTYENWGPSTLTNYNEWIAEKRRKQNDKIAVPDTKIERAQWGNGLEFLMSCIAMSVGLGNVWRFPFTAYENGGGAFLIPYIIVLTVIGRPLYYMEMALGQFTSCGNVKSYSTLSPGLAGIGYGQLVGSICIASYYCLLMALTLFYLVNSFTSDLPWSNCDPDWEVENVIKNLTCVSSSKKESTTQSNKISSSELWFTREVLKQKDQIEDGLGSPEWRLVLCLLVAWTITFLVSIKGVKSSGKVSYFLALFPYVVMGALLIRAVTLEGAAEGILYFITPQWDKLATAEVWYAAVTQCFFSLNVGLGSIIMYASYNSFDHNINRDALVVTTLDTFTSLLAGTTIFGILGNLAHQLNVPVEQVIKSGGTGLAFISYPDAIAKFEDVPWLFSILFFVMLFVLGIGSLVALHGCANTLILDNFPKLPVWQVSGGTALAGFLMGLIYTTQGGQYMLTVVDFFGGNMVIFIFAIFEVVSIMWWYGCENFCNDLEFMTKNKVGTYWRWTWGIVTPASLILIFIYFISTITRLSYGIFPIADWALGIGWGIVVIAMVIFSAAIWKNVLKNKKFGFPQMIAETFTNDTWRPNNEKCYSDWIKEKQKKAEDLAAKKESWFQRNMNFLFSR
ncbi:hypothetical protein FQR65_LT01800 [Abscondita terminalis]|nr:hypothetical protein FQR65_LT01800 [Abscondita terminalis]